MIHSDGKPTIANRVPLDPPKAEPPKQCDPADVLAVIFTKKDALERVG